MEECCLCDYYGSGATIKLEYGTPYELPDGQKLILHDAHRPVFSSAVGKMRFGWAARPRWMQWLRAAWFAVGSA